MLPWIYGGKNYKYITLKVLQSIFFYPWGALWYIQAVIISILLLLPFIKCKKEEWVLPIGLVLYSFCLIANRYYFLIQNTFIQKIVDSYLHIFVSARNGIFVGFLFVGIGLLLRKYFHNILKIKKYIIPMLLFALVLYIGEIYLVKDYSGVDDNAFYIIHVIYIPILFAFSAVHGYKISIDTKLFRKMSTSIYLLHSPVLNIIDLGVQLMFHLVISRWILAVCTLFVISIICFITYKNPKSKFYKLIV